MNICHTCGSSLVAAANTTHDTWQYHGNHIWLFGTPVRGLVRNVRASVWYDGRQWCYDIGDGAVTNFARMSNAVSAAETALGITVPWPPLAMADTAAGTPFSVAEN